MTTERWPAARARSTCWSTAFSVATYPRISFAIAAVRTIVSIGPDEHDERANYDEALAPGFRRSHRLAFVSQPIDESARDDHRYKCELGNDLRPQRWRSTAYGECGENSRRGNEQTESDHQPAHPPVRVGGPTKLESPARMSGIFNARPALPAATLTTTAVASAAVSPSASTRRRMWRSGP
jgi:hypothetical protein